jgi:cobalamin biosynthesis protein CbiD
MYVQRLKEYGNQQYDCNLASVPKSSGDDIPDDLHHIPYFAITKVLILHTLTYSFIL